MIINFYFSDITFYKFSARVFGIGTQIKFIYHIRRFF